MQKSNSEKTYFKNKVYFLRDAHKDDFPFIYNLIEEFLATNLSVTFLKMPSFEDFFKNKIKRYVISDGKNLLGFVQILDNNEIGYFLDKKFRKQGIASEAVQLLMQLNPRERYFATVHDKNEPSKKLIKNLGFLPKATIYEKIINS
jgi:RimJ/RimL family protein N-acetyltransferase